MSNAKELKEKLRGIRDNNWIIPEEVNNYELALQCLNNIGSVDAELRDNLILELLCNMIIEKKLTDKEVKDILGLILSERHLFYNIGKIEDDSVFNRSFSMLIVECIVYRHKESEVKLFNEAEIIRIYKAVIRYLNEEKDVRGYVMVKGWAHTAAHTADVLEELVSCKEIKERELIEILEGIRKKVCINYYAYVNNEEERLVTATISVMERKVISKEKILNWIKGFENMEKTGVYPEDHNLICNHKGFLSALYFRLKRRSGTEEFLHAIEEVINKTTPKHFQ
ncbi:DUF2785 domain-containing protein [Clostridium amazonitimonense]|uniref:DUF2785 domain-containing protein n=1 Tax=Clostridium amazonitimonense TaxID=1499689 RepID=UPI000509D378|nr:DUF2785 domain-containing protein [Clostridium amazonitimonense]